MICACVVAMGLGLGFVLGCSLGDRAARRSWMRAERSRIRQGRRPW